MRRTFATTLTAGLLLLGCTAAGDDDLLDVRATEDPAPEPPEEPGPDPEPDDPYAVPDEIDEAYIELVINAILEVRSEILRGALQQEQGENLDPELMTLLFATTEGRQRASDLEVFQGYIDDPESRGGLLPADQLGSMRFESEYLAHAEPEACIVVVGRWERTQISTRADSDELVIFSLGLMEDATAVSPGNPSPWQWRDNALMKDAEGREIASEHWPDLDYASVLDHSCSELG
jgi:hypothetical protein